MNTGMIERPSEISYEIICALLRTPPRKGYLEFEAQPARTMPYTPMEAMAKVKSGPTLRSAMTSGMGAVKPVPPSEVISGLRKRRSSSLPKGSTAQVSSAGTTTRHGASQK